MVARINIFLPELTKNTSKVNITKFILILVLLSTVVTIVTYTVRESDTILHSESRNHGSRSRGPGSQNETAATGNHAQHIHCS